MTSADDSRPDNPSGGKGRDGRHHAREAALQMLYQWEVGGTDPAAVLQSFWALDRSEQDPPSERVRAFAVRLVQGTVAELTRIDPLIVESAAHWRLSRMAVIDRMIIRLAVYEFLAGETPGNVVINEALELARTFSGDEAVKFINGLLDAIKRKLEEVPLDAARSTPSDNHTP